MTDLGNLHVVLLHWPITNRTGELISTATTNLDIHDIARLTTTYGAGGYWIVQPLANQHNMIERVVGHWTTGPGQQVHPDRPQALAGVRAVRSLVEVDESLEDTTWVVTTARPPGRPAWSPGRLVEALAEDKPVCLCFGTGWGLAPQVVAAADAVLEPIAPTPYNHLSVRSAVSIYLDRIWQAANQ